MRQASVFIAILALVATGCSKSNNPPSASQSTPASTETAEMTPSSSATALPTAITQPFNNGGTANVGSVKTIKIEAGNGGFSFSPSILVGKPGEHLNITVTNVGSVHHNFTLAAQKINSDMNAPGTTITVNVVFPQSGSLQFHCEYHESSGMKGALEVSA
ncbi:MAG: cupredoxin domain-containing protein [Actinomycetota bacterium]